MAKPGLKQAKKQINKHNNINMTTIKTIYHHIKKTGTKIVLLFVLLLFLLPSYAQVQRFPKPEFESGYTQPSTTSPETRSTALEFIDVGVLILVMSSAAWFAIRKRSRKGILWLSIFSLVYFGFYREIGRASCRERV